MDDDDGQVGRILSRRQFLALFGATGATVLVGCGPGSSGSAQPTSAAGQATAGGATAASGLNAEAATSVAVAATQAPTITAEAATQAPAGATAATTVPSAAAAQIPGCVVRPALTEGPYFVDEKLNRSDIRSDPTSGAVKEGVPLALTMRVSQISSGSCTPLEGAVVDIWHCDALGVYSDVTDNAQGFNTVGQKFLRGQQATDANGAVQFTTIYPGWYRGRTVHIHFKVRTDASTSQTYEFTSQLFFDEAVTDQVYAQAPYAQKGQRDTPNSADGIYQNSGGQLTLALTKADQGYASTFDIGLDLSQQPSESQSPGGGPPGGPPPGGRPTRTP